MLPYLNDENGLKTSNTLLKIIIQINKNIYFKLIINLNNVI